MKAPLFLTNPTQGRTCEPPRLGSRWTQRAVWLGIAGWTVLVGVALWWLLRGHGGPSLLLVHRADSLPSTGADRIRATVTTNLGFQRVYPWLLLGPYVALIAWFFPLERGRFQWSLPLNLAACVAFLAAAQTITERTRVTLTDVTLTTATAPKAVQASNSFRLRISRNDLHKLLPATLAKALGARLPRTSAAGRTNLLLGLDRAFASHPSPRFPGQKLWSVLLDLLAYGAIVGLVHSVHFYRRFRERERRTLFLESNLAQARLNALRAQLQPHFLFNSLNAIATLLRRDPRLAEATLMSLSELLRLALSQSEKPEVTLREELQFVQRYLEIQQTRFGDRLRVEQDIAPATLECWVPTLVLQPLVENAIRHGIEPAEETGVVRLTAQRQGDRLVLTVEDDGVGLTSTPIELADEKNLPVPNGPVPFAPTALPVSSHSQRSADPGGKQAKTSLPHSPSLRVGFTDSNAARQERTRVGAGIGLANLRARLEALYGTNQLLELFAGNTGGVLVRIEVPWRVERSLQSRTAPNENPPEALNARSGPRAGVGGTA